MSTDAKIDSIERVLERAAHDAVFGSREARAGRFDQVFTEEKRIVGIILREAQTAYQSWANWEAINAQFSNETLRDAIVELELGAIGYVRAALVRDAVLRGFALLDVYDPIKWPDRLTLCRIAYVVNDDANAELLSSERWASGLGHNTRVSNTAAQKNKERIIHFRAKVLSSWTAGIVQDQSLAKRRADLRPIRNRLAHALEPEVFDSPKVDEIRDFMGQILSLATDMALVFLGHADDAQTFERFSKQRSEIFWEFAFQAPLKTHRRAKLGILSEFDD